MALKSFSFRWEVQPAGAPGVNCEGLFSRRRTWSFREKLKGHLSQITQRIQIQIHQHHSWTSQLKSNICFKVGASLLVSLPLVWSSWVKILYSTVVCSLLKEEADVSGLLVAAPLDSQAGDKQTHNSLCLTQQHLLWAHFFSPVIIALTALICDEKMSWLDEDKLKKHKKKPKKHKYKCKKR